MTLLGGDGGVGGAIGQNGGERHAKPCDGKSEPENSKSGYGHELRCLRRGLGGRLRVHSVVVEDIPDFMTWVGSRAEHLGNALLGD